jgi:hypothetical protein
MSLEVQHKKKIFENIVLSPCNSATIWLQLQIQLLIYTICKHGLVEVMLDNVNISFVMALIRPLPYL